MDAAEKKRLFVVISGLSGDTWSDKEKEILEKILHTEVVLKAFKVLDDQVKTRAYFGFMSIDFTNPDAASKAAFLQGNLRGALGAVDALFELTLQEETENVSES